MADAFRFTARFELVEDGWVQATIDELPGVITAGRSREEAKHLLVDALQTYLLALGDLERADSQQRTGDPEPLLITVGA